jgi:hypothetical protein
MPFKASPTFLVTPPSLILIINTVAKIAFDKLSREHPLVLQKANTLLQVLTSESPHGFHLRKESLYPFVECAMLADDIKRRGGGWQTNWHFIDSIWSSAKEEEESLD